MKEQKIELKNLRFSGNRTYGGEGDLNILAEDIKINGLINPITVVHAGNNIYEVVAGRRRVKAVEKLGWQEITCRVLEGEEVKRAQEIAGAENINRLGMHPLDEAAIFKRLLDNGEAIENLAKRFDRKVSGIWQRLQLLDLDEGVKTLFRNGNLSLQSAAMLKSLNPEAQKEFVKDFKNDWCVKQGKEIDDDEVKHFISNLDHDRLYGFLRDKQCADCKKRTYFTDKNLFPEMDDVCEKCYDHKCYLKKWEKTLEGRIKSLQGQKKTHAESLLIVTDNNNVEKILGKKVMIGIEEYKVLSWNWQNRAGAKDKGAQPCFHVDIKGGSKLEISAEYWKEAERYSAGSNISPASKRKGIAPIVSLLDLPKEEEGKTLEVMANSKRISPYTFSTNVRESVFWRVIEIKAQEFNDPKKIDNACKEIFLKKYLSNINGTDRKIFEAFAKKLSISDISKMPPDKVFALLCAMEQLAWDLPSPEEISKGKPGNPDILKWIGLPTAKVKELYQAEIKKRIPKQKPEAKPGEKKAKPQAAAKPAGKKPARKLPSAKKIAKVNAAKGKKK